MKILIIEDEAMVAMSLRFLLQIDGHEITAIADDFKSATLAADANRPDLAFVDVQLANGDSGLDVAAELNKKEILCLLLTGNPPTTPLPHLAIGCLPKPYSDEALTAAVSVAEAYRQKAELPLAPRGLQLYV